MVLPSRNQRRIDRRTAIAGVLPWFAILAITLSGIYTRIGFGRWPRFGDSPELPFGDTAALLAALAAASLPALIGLALLVSIVRRALRARPVFSVWVLSAWVGTAALSLSIWADPYGFLEWVFD